MFLFVFKVYDIRGCVLEELNEDLVCCIGVVLVVQFVLGLVVLGYDVCLISFVLQDVLVVGLCGIGCEVIDIGLCGMEEVYFQIDYLGVVGGVMVIVSYNLMDYNGMKLVKENVCLISFDIGLFVIFDVVVVDMFVV